MERVHDRRSGSRVYANRPRSPFDFKFVKVRTRTDMKNIKASKNNTQIFYMHLNFAKYVKNMQIMQIPLQNR